MAVWGRHKAKITNKGIHIIPKSAPKVKTGGTKAKVKRHERIHNKKTVTGRLRQLFREDGNG